jgi:NADH:ubiquinone reductase (H+-translocating)
VSRESNEPSVVIIGAGFAGISCARRLGDRGVRVTLIDRHNYNQFQPLLYQVATAQMATATVARPLREAFRRHPSVDVKLACARTVDPATRTVTCIDGTTFQGDHLVLAAGSRPNFYDTPGADTHAFPLYALVDGERLRSRIFEVFEDADRDPAVIEQGALNLVVVGGGPTGVETAGAIADLVSQVMPSRYHDLDVTAAKVVLVDPGQVVLSAFSARAQAYAARVLTEKGVDLELGVKVTDIAEDRVTLSDGRQIMTRTVVWAGGIQPSDVIAQAGITVGHGGRIDVQPDLTVAGFDGIYAIGDAGNTPDEDGKPLPQLGSVAVQAGRWAADNILADITGQPRRPFRYRDKGIMAMIGRNAAVVEIGKRRRELHGVVAFGAWLGVHAWLLSGFRERATAVWAWGWDYFTRDRAPSIISPDAERIDWSEPPPPGGG